MIIKKTKKSLRHIDNHLLFEAYKKIGAVLQPFGEKWRAVCPFHDDENPSLVVYPDGGFYCWGCGKFGSFDSVLSDAGLLNKFNTDKIDISTVQTSCIGVLMSLRKQQELALRKYRSTVKQNMYLNSCDKFDLMWIQLSNKTFDNKLLAAISAKQLFKCIFESKKKKRSINEKTKNN